MQINSSSKQTPNRAEETAMTAKYYVQTASGLVEKEVPKGPRKFLVLTASGEWLHKAASELTEGERECLVAKHTGFYTGHMKLAAAHRRHADVLLETLSELVPGFKPPEDGPG